MIKGKTKTGFEYQFDETLLDDMEFFEMMGKVDENPLLSPKILEKMLGREQLDALYDHVRTEKGNVPIEATMNELEDIFENQTELKK